MTLGKAYGDTEFNGQWDDRSAGVHAANIDVASGRIDYDYADLGIGFQTNARYPNEPLASIVQMTHTWLEGSDIEPHVHWLQSASGTPNILLEYRVYNNGEAPGAFTLVVPDNLVFAYTSGTILQISGFPTIDMSGKRISAFIDFKLYRDSLNTSGLFAGADAYPNVWIVKEFDFHFRKDAAGSIKEFSKR